jgi:signal peptidase complex subunit 3
MFLLPHSVKGRPHYYSTKKEEYAHIRFSLDADLSSLFTWNTKQVFVYVTASWPVNSTAGAKDVEAGSSPATNEAVIWDTIITSPSADHLSNIGAAALRKLIKSAKGKSIDPSRYVSSIPIHNPCCPLHHHMYSFQSGKTRSFLS